MKKTSRREIAMMLAPVLAFGAFAWWKSRVPSATIESPPVPPIGYGKGNLRLEFGEWKTLAPDAGEVATGHLIVKSNRVWLVGQNATQWRDTSFDLQDDLALEFRRGQKWQKVARNGGWNGFRERKIGGFDEKAPILNQEFALSLPMNLVPRDADEVRLRGKIKIRVLDRRAGNFRDVASPAVSLPIWNKKQSWPAPEVSRETQLTVDEIKTTLWGEAAENSLHNSSAAPWTTAEIEAALNTHWAPPAWDKNYIPFSIVPQSVQLLDKTGRDWMKWKPRDGLDDYSTENMGNSPDIAIGRMNGVKNIEFCHVAVSTRQIPRSAGEIRLKARVSLYDHRVKSAQWPVNIEAVVRPAWMSQAPKNLVLKSARLVTRKNTGYAGSPKEPCIEAILEYSGKKPLVIRGEVDNSPYRNFGGVANEYSCPI